MTGSHDSRTPASMSPAYRSLSRCHQIVQVAKSMGKLVWLDEIVMMHGDRV